MPDEDVEILEGEDAEKFIESVEEVIELIKNGEIEGDYYEF